MNAKQKVKPVSHKLQRLVEWNAGLLARYLRQIVAGSDVRITIGKTKKDIMPTIESLLSKGNTGLEEFKEIITLPIYTAKEISKRRDPNLIELDEAVMSQLREFVATVAAMYRDNAFHNFEHASHVTASVTTLLRYHLRPNDPICRRLLRNQ